MIERYESKQDGVFKATYRIETNFEGEKSSIENQTAVRTTVGDHRMSDHRNLEMRLEAGGR